MSTTRAAPDQLVARPPLRRQIEERLVGRLGDDNLRELL